MIAIELKKFRRQFRDKVPVYLCPYAIVLFI